MLIRLRGVVNAGVCVNLIQFPVHASCVFTYVHRHSMQRVTMLVVGSTI